MLREQGIASAVLKHCEQREATASQVLKHFKVHHSANQQKREKEECIYGNLDSFLTLLQGRCTYGSKANPSFFKKNQARANLNKVLLFRISSEVCQ